MTDKTHWKVLINPEYIGAYWLHEGQDSTVTIDRVVREQVKGTGGKTEECTVAHLKGAKPFILNVTNSKSIAKLYGPYIEDWAGKPITLFASTAKLAGDTVECLRIRPVVATRQKRAINEERFKKALAAIQAGTYTADELAAGYALTLQQESTLEAALEAMAGGEIPEVANA